MGYPCSRRKTKILWVFAPAKHRIKLGAGGRRWRRPSRLSVLSFICLSAVILHNYTLSNQKMREGRGREQPASWQERRGEENGPLLRSQSRTLGPLDDGARRRSVPSLLFDRLVVLLQTKWARCKNMQCIGLHHLTLCVTSLSN